MAAQHQLSSSARVALAEIDAFLEGQLLGASRTQAPATALGKTQQHPAAAEEGGTYARVQVEADGVGQAGCSQGGIRDLDPILAAQIIAHGAQVEAAMVRRPVRQAVTVM